MLVPPDNFGLVESGVYRCSKLESDHFPFLETLKLKSLIVLDAEKPPRLLTTFLDTNNIELYNLGGLKISNHYHTGANSNLGKDDDDGDDVNSISSSRRVSSVSANEIELINLGDTTTGGSSGDLDRKKNDQWMLIEKNLILRAFELVLNKNKHNLLLVDSTLTLVGILRKIQKWNFNSIVNEYRIYTGAPSKSNYYAENFLELIQPELVSFELEQLKASGAGAASGVNGGTGGSAQAVTQAAHTALTLATQSTLNVTHALQTIGIPSRSRSNQSILYEPTFVELDDDLDIDEDELTDDDLLSASPQIPANLLKLVEKRKHEKANRSNLSDVEDIDKSSSLSGSGRRRITPGSSPKHYSTLKRNSITNEMFFSTALGGRRRSSVDKFRPSNSNNNTKFRTGSNVGIGADTGLPSSFPGVRRLSKGKAEAVLGFDNLSVTEAQAIRERYDFKFYKNLHRFPVKYENVNTIKIKLPPDEKLPLWFIKSRDFWECNFRKLNSI